MHDETKEREHDYPQLREETSGEKDLCTHKIRNCNALGGRTFTPPRKLFLDRLVSYTVSPASIRSTKRIRGNPIRRYKFTPVDEAASRRVASVGAFRNGVFFTKRRRER